jgi:hypothetical protein
LNQRYWLLCYWQFPSLCPMRGPTWTSLIPEHLLPQPQLSQLLLTDAWSRNGYLTGPHWVSCTILQALETGTWRYLSFHIGCLTWEGIHNRKPCLAHIYAKTDHAGLKKEEWKKSKDVHRQKTMWL